MDFFLSSPITIIIIIITGLVSFQGFNNPTIIYKTIFNPVDILERKQYYRLITSGFIHADWSHLIFNMFSFYFFGRNLETILTYEGNIFGSSLGYGPEVGSVMFVVFYLSSLVASSLPDLIKHKNNPNYNSLGASGAVNAIIFGSVLFGPWETIYIYMIPVPSIVFAFVYLGYTYYASKTGRQQGINHNAHLYGALFGVILTLIMIPASASIFWQGIQHPHF